MYRLIRPLLFLLDPERAHDLSLGLLSRAGWLSPLLADRPPPDPVRVMGLQLPNPVGLAAGLDKNGEYIDALARLGFGFLEIGTVTPRAQPGNERPRMFRLAEAQAVINRLGFNNRGVEYLVDRVRHSRYRGILGINIGKNFDTPNDRAIDDYRTCLRAVHDVASYVTINISSPNTRGLRDLQHGDALPKLLDELLDEATRLDQASGRRVPLAFKVAPDQAAEQLEAQVEAFNAIPPAAVIATNTTIDRAAVAGLKHGSENGGLSGAPLLQRATEVLSILRAGLRPEIDLIGVGGIVRGADAAAKIRAGAAAVQIYSGMIYRGPALVGEAGRAIRAA